MKIALVSKLWEATAPESTGGTGAAVGYLAAELKKRGHQVTLFASSDSMQTVELVATTSSDEFRKNYSEAREFLNIAAAFDRRRRFDIIHCHNEYKSLGFGAASLTPSLHTVSYGEFFVQEREVFNQFKHLNFVGISQAVKNLLPELNWRGIVQHGIDVGRFPFRAAKQDYLLFLGRLSPQKGPDVAIRVAQKLGKRLILAGKKSASDVQYLQAKVDPFVDGEQIKYVGEVGFAEKIELLGNARCLLHPVNFLEAFGLTLVEAMACGTPVIAFDQGAIREVIADGQTGFIVKDEGEIAAAVGNLSSISAKDCRARVEKYFTVEQMVDGYEKIYGEIIDRGINRNMV